MAELFPIDPPRPWTEHPLLLALMGAISIHLMIAVAGDALVVLNPPRPEPPPAPTMEIVDVEVPPPETKPPEPDHAPEPDKAPDVVHRTAVAPTRISHVRSEPLPSTPPASAPEGGAPIFSLPDVPPGATGVPVAKGPLNKGPIGRGGTGTGTGTGSGSGDAPPAPMSVATIKTRAMPKGDYSYEESKDYPEEAKQLAVGGRIKIKLIVDQDGKVKTATLLNRLGHGLDELALSRANKIVFDPAKDTDDKPVTSVVVWTFEMSPPK